MGRARPEYRPTTDPFWPTDHRGPFVSEVVAQTPPLSVSELLSNGDRFNGWPVTVRGTISNFRGNPWHRGSPNYTFDLSDGTATVHVISYMKPS